MKRISEVPRGMPSRGLARTNISMVEVILWRLPRIKSHQTCVGMFQTNDGVSSWGRDVGGELESSESRSRR